MTLILGEAEVRSSVSMEHLVEVLREGLRLEAEGRVDSVPRVNLAAGEQFFRLMPAAVEGLDLMGFKIFNGSAARGVRYLAGVIQASSGELLSLMDASYLTAIRTGATTALAVSLMSPRREWDEVGVIGSGLEARTNLEGLAAVSRINHATVFSPNPERRSAFASEMTAELGFPVDAASTGAEAADAEVVLVATNTGPRSGVIALDRAWLDGDVIVGAIGSTMPVLREVDHAVFPAADTVVLDTPHAVDESGDLLAARDAADWDPGEAISLADLTLEPIPERRGIKVFKSVGTALQDILAAAAVYDAAHRSGIGTEIDFLDLKLF